MENTQQATELEPIVSEPQQFQPQPENMNPPRFKNLMMWGFGIAAVVLICGGAYVYFQRQEVQLKNQKTFIESSGIYSVNYPNDWTYSEGQLSARFETIKEGESQSFEVELETDLDSMIKTLSQRLKGEKVTIKSNTFTKFIEPTGYTAYFLPIGVVESHSTFLAVLIKESTKINKSDLDSFLGSIKVDSSKAALIVKLLATLQSNAQIMANVANMRTAAELYFDSEITYVGICEGSNKKAKEVSIDKNLESTLKLVSAQDIYCNASSDKYVYSVRMPGGEIRCADSTGFSDTISTNAKTLSCK